MDLYAVFKGAIGILATAAMGACAETVDVAAFGIRPDTKENLTPAVRQLMRACTNGPATIVLPKGRYDFWPDKPGAQSVAFNIEGANGLTLDGSGSTLVFHGLMMPFRLLRSGTVALRDFSIDWDRPFISQGRIIGVTGESVDIEIDKAQYPYVIEGDRAWFTGEDWKRGVEGYNILYDKRTKGWSTKHATTLWA